MEQTITCAYIHYAPQHVHNEHTQTYISCTYIPYAPQHAHKEHTQTYAYIPQHTNTITHAHTDDTPPTQHVQSTHITQPNTRVKLYQANYITHTA